MKRIAISMIFFFTLALAANLLPISAAQAAGETYTCNFCLMDGVSQNCMQKGDCTPCDAIQVGVNLSDMIVAFSGAAAILMFIVGGIFMITAYGSDRINLGKNAIVAALVGILIVFAAWTIVNTLILAFFGNNSGEFTSALGRMTQGAATKGLDYKCR